MRRISAVVLLLFLSLTIAEAQGQAVIPASDLFQRMLAEVKLQDYHPAQTDWSGWPREVIPPEWPFTATDCRKLLPEMYALRKKEVALGELGRDAVVELYQFSQGCDFMLMTESDPETKFRMRLSLPLEDYLYLKVSAQLQNAIVIQLGNARLLEVVKQADARERQWNAAFDKVIALVLAGGISAPASQGQTLAESLKQMSAAMTETMRTTALQQSLEDIARASRDQAETLRQFQWQLRQREALKLIKP